MGMDRTFHHREEHCAVHTRLLRQPGVDGVGWDWIGKETRLYLQCSFLTHSPNGPSFRIRVDPRRVI